jgi:hypothetical protein
MIPDKFAGTIGSARKSTRAYECASGRTRRFAKAPLIHCQIPVKRAGSLPHRADSHRRIRLISVELPHVFWLA